MKKVDSRRSASVDRPPWGILSCIDLYECDPQIIRSAEAIERFVAELCDLIEMKRFGKRRSFTSAKRKGWPDSP
jgi:hypothetical protein